MAPLNPPPPFTLANLQTLAAALAQGVTEVRFQDRTVRYSTPTQMQIAYTALYNAVYPGNGTTPGPTRQYRMRTGTGIRW
jgi:hypothetical protein